ncbi:MAG: sigma-54 dependent transcriptional regulator [Thermodesulfovibrionales bacterium]|nr:sigma-54 dependent transcriptional regulator [Thermodesulfovibrionales bacterium]
MNIKNSTVLIVDDEPEILESLDIIFRSRGFKPVLASSGAQAVELFSNSPIPVIISDNVLPDTQGIELLKEFRGILPEVQMIMITGKGTIDLAVSAMKAGVFDFVTKPFDPEHLIQLVMRARELYDALTEKNTLREEVEKITQQDIIGSHPSIKKLLGLIATVSQTDSTVLVEGESGTGKELVARLIHKKSKRSAGPFVPVDSGAIPEGLVESEIFGHEKGAFTGAAGTKIGKFERAAGGTLFLDEITNFPLSSQAKLLRVLQEGVIERVGGVRQIPVDIRVIAATNIDLAGAVKRGMFRDDLYYRLNIIKLRIPPLRERMSDILELSTHFIKKHLPRINGIAKGISTEAIRALMEYRWPGNVRELENAVEHALILSKSELIMPKDLPSTDSAVFVSKLDEIEKAAIIKAMKDSGGNKYRAAKILGIQRSTLYSKLKKLGLSDADFP